MGTHLINGEWVGSSNKDFFQAFSPTTNAFLPRKFSEGGEAEVDNAACAAQTAFTEYAGLPDYSRAGFLRTIAERINLYGNEITAAAEKETALPAARLNGERGRTVNQLQMFADFIESGDHLDIWRTAALPSREPLPHPDLRLIHRPLGVVGVFGASNFPLAFSVAGGDTASALAAGCPVIVKGHPAHPHTGEIVARAVDEARSACDLPPGVFSFIQGTTPTLSNRLVSHCILGAVAFTGSLRAGRALYDVANRRDTPIPFYAEMGSVNPVFILPSAASENLLSIACGWAQSLVLGAGQFCTNPGILFCPASAVTEFKQNVVEALSGGAVHTMLTPGIARTYHQITQALEKHVYWRGGRKSGDCCAETVLLHCDLDEWLATPNLQEEIFGPVGVVIAYQETAQLAAALDALPGQLTATLWLSEEDYPQAAELLPKVEQKVGRLLCNGFPTGVEVADAMMHGGPYPAATYPATSVGALAIRRFLRAVCYQNFPDNLLPPPLR